VTLRTTLFRLPDSRQWATIYPIDCRSTVSSDAQLTRGDISVGTLAMANVIIIEVYCIAGERVCSPRRGLPVSTRCKRRNGVF